MNLPQPADTKWLLLAKWLESYSVITANQPRPGDTENELLRKILRQVLINAGQSATGTNAPRPGDTDEKLLSKILNVLNP